MLKTTIYYDGSLFFRIKGASRYYVSRCGRVLSMTGKRPKILPGSLQGKGYLQTIIKLDDGSIRRPMIHQLIAEQFIRRRQGKTDINHLDSNRLNNHVSNLEWCTKKENNRHAREMKFSRSGQHRFPFY